MRLAHLIAPAVLIVSFVPSLATGRYRPLFTQTSWTYVAGLTGARPVLAYGDVRTSAGVTDPTLYLIYNGISGGGIYMQRVFRGLFGSETQVPSSSWTFKGGVPPAVATDEAGRLWIFGARLDNGLSWIQGTNTPNGITWGSWQTLDADCSWPTAIHNPASGTLYPNQLHVVCVAQNGTLKYYHRINNGAWVLRQSLAGYGAYRPKLLFASLDGRYYLLFTNSLGQIYLTRKSTSQFSVFQGFQTPVLVPGTWAYPDTDVTLELSGKRLQLARFDWYGNLYTISSVYAPGAVADLSAIWTGSSWTPIALGYAFDVTREIQLLAFHQLLLLSAQSTDGAPRLFYRDPSSVAIVWRGGYSLGGTPQSGLSMVRAERAFYQSNGNQPNPTLNEQEAYAAVRAADKPQFLNLFRSFGLAATSDNEVTLLVDSYWSQLSSPDGTAPAGCGLNTCAPNGRPLSCNVTSECPTDYFCDLYRPHSGICRKDCGSGCAAGEQCVPAHDWVVCGPSSAPVRDSPLLNEVVLGLLSWPQHVLDKWKSQNINPFWVKPDSTFVSGQGRFDNAQTVRLSGDTIPPVAHHEIGHAFLKTVPVGYANLRPWSYTVQSNPPLKTYTKPFDQAGGNSRPCGTACSVPPCPPCDAPLICNTAGFCASRACCTTGDCFVNSVADPCYLPPTGGACDPAAPTGSCNAGRPYGATNSYATAWLFGVAENCTDYLNCHAFIEAATTYRFGGDVLRSLVLRDRDDIDIAYRTLRLCDHHDFVRSQWYGPSPAQSVLFEGSADDRGLTYRGAQDGIPAGNQVFACQ